MCSLTENPKNWRLLINSDLMKLQLTLALPSSAKNPGTSLGSGSESGKGRATKFTNSYCVKTLTCLNAKIEKSELYVQLEDGSWYPCLWVLRYQNPKWAHHSTIDDVKSVIKTAKSLKII